jgi:hypothetical protein
VREVEEVYVLPYEHSVECAWRDWVPAECVGDILGQR